MSVCARQTVGASAAWGGPRGPYGPGTWCAGADSELAPWACLWAPWDPRHAARFSWLPVAPGFSTFAELVLSPGHTVVGEALACPLKGPANSSGARGAED